MKRLIVCSDGTWNSLNTPTPTNVVKLAKAVAVQDQDGIGQCLFYDQGVGTEVGNPLSNLTEKIFGGGFGWGLGHNVKQAYQFLVNNFQAGDEIFLFGFSRGAYTVRALAGFIAFAGLLNRGQMTKIEQAYQLYQELKLANCDQALQFRDAHQTQIPTIKCLGCWDTVGSLGIPDKLSTINLDKTVNANYQFVDEILGPHIENAFHALALHETRREFRHTPMVKHPETQQKLEQVWFAGDHSAIGGGDSYKQALSNISLEWMAQHANNLGLAIDFELLDADGQEPLAYFKPVDGVLYSTGKREVPNDAQFHPTALQQFVDIPFQETLSEHTKHILHTATLNLAPRVMKTKEWLSLAPNEARTILITANELEENPSYILVEAGAEYKIEASPICYWQDGDVFCTADGWHEQHLSEQNKQVLSELELYLIQKSRHHRVLKSGNWFSLCMSYDNNPSHDDDLFVVGLTRQFTASKTAPLYAFANDIKTHWYDTYGNNLGWLPVRISRLS